MKKRSILILVVLYKRGIYDSETIRSLLEQNLTGADYKLVLWDNSPNVTTNPDLDLLKKHFSEVEYISSPENEWLSKAYNKVLKANAYDYYLLFDQDSNLPEGFMDVCIKSIDENPEIGLCLPLVKNGDRIVSPGDFWIFKGKHWKEATHGLLKAKNLLAITSGLLISAKYLQKYNHKFDERLNLYAIDSKFLLDYAKNQEYLYLMPTTIAHNSVLWSNPTADVMLNRFRNFRKAWSIMLSDSFFPYALTNIHTTYLSVKHAIKYRDTRFLKK
jgi:GT2 family glycosyltransferase